MVLAVLAVLTEFILPHKVRIICQLTHLTTQHGVETVELAVLAVLAETEVLAVLEAHLETQELMVLQEIRVLMETLVALEEMVVALTIIAVLDGLLRVFIMDMQDQQEHQVELEHQVLVEDLLVIT